MNFKQFIESKRKELHSELIRDICMIVNNCADCHNEVTRQTECVPDQQVNLYKVTKTSFYMDCYDGTTNERLLNVGRMHGYEAGVVSDGSTENYIKFWK